MIKKCIECEGGFYKSINLVDCELQIDQCENSQLVSTNTNKFITI